MKILFLGYEKNPVIDFLKRMGDEVVQTTEGISLEEISRIGPEAILSYGYRHIIKPGVIEYASGLVVSGIVNLHIAHLPWNRGADPNFWSWLEHTPKGYSIHYIDAGIDSGNLLVQREAEFSENETLATSYAKLRQGIENLFMENWEGIKRGLVIAREQEGKGTMHYVKDLDKYRFLFPDAESPKFSEVLGKEIEEYGRKHGLWRM